MSKTPLFQAHSQSDVCPECGAALQIRQGKQGLFLGCSAYPACDYLRPLQQRDGHIIKVLEGQPCPACQADLVLRQGRYGMFVGCSAYPQCDYTQALDAPEQTAAACPQCHSGQLLQRLSRYGKTFYACDRYPACQFAVNYKPISRECPHCHYSLLLERKTAHGVRLQCANKQCGRWIDHD